MGDKTFTHPSYGIIGVNRRSNGRPSWMFGSSVRDQYHTVSVEIAECIATEDDSGIMQYRAGARIVELELTAAQFAEAITAMNFGDGVPCTLRRHRVGGGPYATIEDPPEPQTDVERSHEAFEKTMGAFGAKVDRLVAVVDKATDASGISKKAREEIRSATNVLAQEVRSNIPFYLRLFGEAADRIVTARKAEADAWMTNLVHRSGLESLLHRGLPQGDPPAAAQLPASSEGERKVPA